MDKGEMKDLLLTMAAFGASFILKKSLEAGYEKVYDEDPPNAVTDKKVHWGKVIGWTIVSGLAATATKVLIKRYGAQQIDD